MRFPTAVLFSAFCGTFFALAPAARGQAHVDPSLPFAPLPNRPRSYLFPDFETVRNPHRNVPPLRNGQKFEIAYRTIASPSFLIDPIITTAFEEATDLGPDYGGGMGGAAERFGSNATTLAVTTLLTDAVLPTAFHQDPRYFRKGTGPVKSRIWWAIRADFVAYGDDGHEMPNYASMLGLAGATAISNIYLPREDVSFGQTMEGWGIKEGVRAGTNVLREFGGVGWLKKKLRRKKN